MEESPYSRTLKLTIKIILIAFLIGAIKHMPYGYYQLTKAVVFAGSILLAFQSYKRKQVFTGAIFGIIAIVFVPFGSYDFKREEWQVIDKLTLGVVFLSICYDVLYRRFIRG